MCSTLYFEYNAATNSVSIFSDRDQNHGGSMLPGEGYGGNTIEAFKNAVAGKMVGAEDGTYLIKPMRTAGRAPA